MFSDELDAEHRKNPNTGRLCLLEQNPHTSSEEWSRLTLIQIDRVVCHAQDANPQIYISSDHKFNVRALICVSDRPTARNATKQTLSSRNNLILLNVT